MARKQKNSSERMLVMLEVKKDIVSLFMKHKVSMAEAFFVMEEIRFDSLTGSRIILSQKEKKETEQGENMFR